MFAIIKFISKKNKDSHQTKIKIHNFTHWKTLFAISYLIQEKRKKSSYKSELYTAENAHRCLLLHQFENLLTRIKSSYLLFSFIIQLDWRYVFAKRWKSGYLPD